MSIIQSCQLCTLSSVDSLFEGAHMSLRLNYSSSLRCRSYCSNRSYIRSCAVNEQDLPENSRFLVRKDRYQRSLRQTSLSQSDRIDRNSSEASVSKSNRRDGNSSTAWLDKWKETSQRFPRKGPREALNYRSRENVLRSFDSIGGSSENNASGSTMERIVEKLKKFGYMDDGNEGGDDDRERRIEKGSVEDIFYVEEGMLPNTRGGFSNGLSLELDKMIDGKDEVLFPWEQPATKAEEAKNSVIRRSRTYVAELTIPESELRRLKNLTLKTKKKVRIGGSGVTQAVVDTIHQQWKSSEVVRLKVEGAPALNMKRMHEILERKTGGLVIWRSGTSVSLYRGVSYEFPQKERGFQKNGTQGRLMLDQDIRPFSQDYSDSKLSPEVRFQKTGETKRDVESAADVNYEDEMDKLLSDLGPRYEDWPGDDLLPVDADLLPNVVPGYQPPFRLLPYGVRRTLGMKESTSLRRIARTLPPHFALGRSRQLEGLAAAIVKLWEKSSIAKVALKRGVQLTTSEKMAEELKRLTGGVLLSRNKDFLVFYRGKDFLSSDVTEVLLEREKLVNDLQDEEEHLRKRASASYIPSAGNKENAAGTLSETLDANSKWGKMLDQHETEKVLRQAEIMRHADLVRKLERKLYFAERKLFKAEQTLSKVEESLKPADQQQDPESITDEERFMFRKLGLRMKAFLLLGRRGVFDGTVENMHLHWKYRELVKIIVKEKNLEDVKSIALALEVESGGVLVSVDKVSKGYAVIVFRGKDYERPRTLRPKNLLTKRKALARSIEMQRREALLKHIAQVQQNVEKLKSEIEHMSIMEEKDQNNAEFYDKLDAAYSTEDEEVEDEGDEAYLTTYDDESDGDEADSSDFANSTNNFKSQTTEEEAAEVQEEDETIGRFA